MKKRESFKDKLLEALLELVFTAFCVGIGFGIVWLFGGEPFEFDFYLIALVGIASLVFTGTLVGAVVHFFKKTRKKKIQEEDKDNDLS